MSCLINLTRAFLAVFLAGCAISFPSGKDSSVPTAPTAPKEQTEVVKPKPKPQPKQNTPASSLDKPEVNALSIELLSACDAGDKASCGAVARLYDISSITKLYRGACEEGKESACARLGQLYESGEAGPAKQVVQIYRDSCNRGGADACYLLANIYRRGEIVAQDYALAMQAYEVACQADNVRACANIGAMYEMGLGVAQDEVRAYKIYRVACFRGLNAVCSHMKDLKARLKID